MPAITPCGYVVEGQPLDGLYHGMGLWRPVAPAYFEALTIPVLRGRTFTDLDSLDAPRVVIINQAMADRWWPHGDPIGERLTLGRGIGGIWEEPSREIVGVVGNVRDAAADRDPEPTSYLPIAQLSDGVSTLMDEVTWLVKTRNLSGALRARIERTVQQASGSMSVTTARSLETIKPQAAARAALRMWLMSVFAGVALLLAAIGVYGVMSHAVRQRTREIGIRIAIGAEPRHVTRLVVLTSLRYSFLGIVAGVACAVGEGRLLTAFLFGVTPWDPMALSTVVILLSFTAVVSAWLPARSAARVDPVVALRPE